MRSAGRCPHKPLEFRAPAQFLPLAHGGQQWPLAGEPTAESPGHPSADVIEVVGGMNQVEDRILH
ncbi:MAG TPA: hypothetical protein VF482_22550, partial [Trebonia sp.]